MSAKLPGAQKLKDALDDFKPRVFDAIDLVGKKEDPHDIGLFDDIGEVLFYVFLIILVVFGVFVAIQMIRILPRIPAKLDADAIIPNYAKTQTESQIKLANISEQTLEEFKSLNRRILKLEQDNYKQKLDTEWLINRLAKKKPFYKPSVNN